MTTKNKIRNYLNDLIEAASAMVDKDNRRFAIVAAYFALISFQNCFKPKEIKLWKDKLDLIVGD